MNDVVLLNSKFEKEGTVAVSVDLSPKAINVPVVHQVVKSLLAGRRQGNACTKNKALVSGGGIKPFRQKGTGRARQGSTRSPLQIGGGRVFGPVPRDYTEKINKKMMTKAIQSVIADKFQNGKLIVLNEIKASGKTKEMYKELSERNLLPALIVTESTESKVLIAARNIKNAKAIPVKGFSVYEAVKYEHLIIEKTALENLLSRLV